MLNQEDIATDPTWTASLQAWAMSLALFRAIIREELDREPCPFCSKRHSEPVLSVDEITTEVATLRCRMAEYGYNLPQPFWEGCVWLVQGTLSWGDTVEWASRFRSSLWVGAVLQACWQWRIGHEGKPTELFLARFALAIEGERTRQAGA